MPQTLYTNQTPALPDLDDGAPGIGTATTVQFAANGVVTGIQFYATTTVSGTYVIELWEVTGNDDTPGNGSILASKTLSAPPTAGQFNEVSFTTPVDVVTDTLYRCVLWSGAGRYVATSGFYTTDPLTNGDITAYATGTDPNPPGFGSMRQGTFVINAAAGNYPSGNGNGTSYFVGPVFTLASVVSEGICFLGIYGTAAAPKQAAGVGVANLGIQTAGSAAKQADGAGLLWTGTQTATAAPKQATGAGVLWAGILTAAAAVKQAAAAAVAWLGIYTVEARPPADLTFTAGPVGPKWFFGTLGNALGQRGNVNQSGASTAYIQCPVTAWQNGAPFDPSSSTVAMAFLTPGITPTSGDWHTGSWDTDPAGSPIAQVLVGPAGTLTLSRGVYQAWVKVTDSPEVPVAPVGIVQIT